jgi:co-chaperonin GroES (HSP10)
MSDEKGIRNPDYPRPQLTDIGSATLRGRRLLLKQWQREKMTEGGLELPASALDNRAVAHVLMIGRGVGPEDALEVGDTVLFEATAFAPIPELSTENEPGYGDVGYLNVDDVVMHWPQSAAANA